MKQYIGKILQEGEDGIELSLRLGTNEMEIQSALHSDRAAIDMSMQAISLPFWANLAGMVVSMHQVLPVSFGFFALGCVLLVLTCGLAYIRQSLITLALVIQVRTGKPCAKFNKAAMVMMLVCLCIPGEIPGSIEGALSWTGVTWKTVYPGSNLGLH